MKTLYIECKMGAAGDMLAAALLELLPNPAVFFEKMAPLRACGVTLAAETAERCGIRGTHLAVTVDGQEEISADVPHHHHDHDHPHEHDHHHHDHHHDHPHHHATLAAITKIIEGLDVSAQVKDAALAVYRRIAEAEAAVHGRPVDAIHFHEVGTLDAVADVVGVCLLRELLAPAQIIVSPVHVGSGKVRCAHGILPVNAPATAYLLRDVPIYSGSIEAELCTPTGAELLTALADRFGAMPPMRVSAVGYGMGKKDLPAANCVRAFLGETEDAPETIAELRCEVDDMTGEETAFAAEQIFAAGALDVYTTPVGMKKGRPGILLTVLCRETSRADVLRAIFRHTSTIGVRETVCTRHVLDREEMTAGTPWGDVRIKTVRGDGVTRSKPEYEDLARLARENGISLREVRDTLK